MKMFKLHLSSQYEKCKMWLSKNFHNFLKDNCHLIKRSTILFYFLKWKKKIKKDL